MTVLVPGYSLTAGPQEWTTQLVGLDLKLAAAPLLDVLEVTLPAAAPADAALGDPVELRVDGGEGEELVFTGTVDAVQRSVTETRLRCLDAGGALARSRPAQTFEQATAATVVQALCSEVGASAGQVEDGVSLAYYAADPRRTAWQHVARLAAWSGALARVSADNRVGMAVVNGTRSELALRYGREVRAVVQAQLAAPVEDFVVAGESGAGTCSAPEALRPTSDFFAGSRPAGPSSGHEWQFEPALRTASAAATAGAAVQRRYRSGRARVVLDAILLPALRPGVAFEVQDLPDGLQAGPWWVTGVRHRLSGAGAVTRVSAWQGGASFDPSALLGSLAGALGGIL